MKVKGRPIKPNEIIANRNIPCKVFDVFNELIAKNYDHGQATVFQEDVVRLIKFKLKCTSKEIFDNGWLNIEDFYAKAGWTVIYDKPGYNEDYKANFVFNEE